MTDSTMQLVLVRHGESEWNKLNLFTGWMDVDLTDTGRKEASDGGRALAEAGFDFDVCYTSYLKRAIHTLNHILQAMDREWLPVNKTWRLNERHYGALQGLNKAETAAKYGEDQVKIWQPQLRRTSSRIRGSRRDADLLALWLLTATLPLTQMPLAECLKDTIARAWPYFEEEIGPQMRAGKRVLISCSRQFSARSGKAVRQAFRR